MLPSVRGDDVDSLLVENIGWPLRTAVDRQPHVIVDCSQTADLYVVMVGSSALLYVLLRLFYGLILRIHDCGREPVSGLQIQGTTKR